MSWLSTLWFLGDDFLLIFERRSSTSNMGQLSITFDQRMNMSGERAGKIMVCSLFKLIIYTLLVHENERQFHRIGVGDRLKKGCLNLARCLPAHWIWAFYLCQINWITKLLTYLSVPHNWIRALLSQLVAVACAPNVLFMTSECALSPIGRHMICAK